MKTVLLRVADIIQSSDLVMFKIFSLLEIACMITLWPFYVEKRIYTFELFTMQFGLDNISVDT